MCTPRLYVTGLGVQYPPYLLGPEKLDEFAKEFYDITSPGLQRLLHINRSSGIETRSAIQPYDSGLASHSSAPSLADIDDYYRHEGVDLAAQACKKALQASSLDVSQVTHTIAVTCTNQGNPGFDLLVNRELHLAPTVDRMLLHGVGCAGGLSILRAAAQIASGASARKKPARILAYACELCTLNVRRELSEAESMKDPRDVTIAAALFSDAAGAFVLCNDNAVSTSSGAIKPLLELIEWDCALIPETIDHLAFYPDAQGFRTILTRHVPEYTMKAIQPMFDRLLVLYQERLANMNGGCLKAADFTWALHPGGRAIIGSVSDIFGLDEEQLEASREIYRTRGNSSSPSVLAVLERILGAGKKKDHIVATSFGPGLTIEMAMLRWYEGGMIR